MAEARQYLAAVHVRSIDWENGGLRRKPSLDQRLAAVRTRSLPGGHLRQSIRQKPYSTDENPTRVRSYGG